jgi:hypothetical protein
MPQVEQPMPRADQTMPRVEQRIPSVDDPMPLANGQMPAAERAISRADAWMWSAYEEGLAVAIALWSPTLMIGLDSRADRHSGGWNITIPRSK